MFLVSWWAINYSPFQNYLVKKATTILSNKLQTIVAIKHVDFSMFNKVLVQGILINDKQKDTLLYAGEAKLNITDWFFFKDSATLKYISLQDTKINLLRNDSIWNYQFILDQFTSPKKKSTHSKGIAFDFKNIELKNVQFNQIDKWVGQDLGISISKLNIDADNINFDKNYISINSINVSNPILKQYDYQGNRDKLHLPIKIKPKPLIEPKYQWNNDGWVLNIKNINLVNGIFKNDKETVRLPYTNQFDGQHILFAGITGTIKNVSFTNDTLTANIKISTKEQCGFDVKMLQSSFKFTPQIMEFNNLNLQTNKSSLGNYYAMEYQNFNKDMSNFINDVNLNGRFEKSILNSDDIAFFAPELKNLKRVVEISGTAKGTIDNLVAKNLILKSSNTNFEGNISLRGLPDIKTTFIDIKSNQLHTTYQDLITFVPVLKSVTIPQLSKLGNLNFVGNYTGFINDFVTYGNITTNLGNVVADLNMKLPESKPAIYSGKVSTAGFKLNQFLNNNKLGNIAFDGNVSGTGFYLKDLNANFKGNVKEMQLSGYNYKNIEIDGSFQKQLFTGHGNINDPNLKIDNFNGTVSLATKDPIFNFDASLQKFDFKNLGFSNEAYDLQGRFKLNFTGNNIDNFLGSARVYDATLKHQNIKLSFDSLNIQSYISNQKKHLSFQSNEIAGYVNGNFKILELPNAFVSFLSHYYPTYIKKNNTKINNQDFSFYIKTNNVEDYINLVDKKLKGFNNAEFSGNIALANNELNINATIPQFEYDKKIFNNLKLESKGNLDTLFTNVLAGDIVINDSLHFPESNFTITSNNDVSVLHLNTLANKTLNQATLNASVQTLSDGVKIHFSPSSFIINDKQWQLENDGILTIRKSYIDASEVKFVQGNQQIIFSTEMAQDGSNNTNVVAKLTKVNINDFTPLFLKSPRLEGILSGTITLNNFFEKPYIEYDATAEDFKLDNKLLGNANLSGSVNTASGLIKSKGFVESNQYKFNVDASYNLKDSSDNPMTINFLAERFDISILDNYLGKVFSEMKGNAISTLKIVGGKHHNTLVGKVTVNDGSLVVNYTKCKYKFSNQTINFNPDEIDLGYLQLKDTLNNEGVATGKIYHNLFDDFNFDNLKFETNKMLLLNTNKKDNNQFYGKVMGSATLSVNGPLSNMRMKINGAPSNIDSSHIFLPTGESREASEITYIDFIQFGKKMDDNNSEFSNNIFVDMDFKANPTCKIDVILDEQTGDIISGNGNGDLHITVGTTEPLNIRGKYEITNGDYTFNFQTFLKKPFSLNKGTIIWNGDPYLANINIEAEYLAKNIDLSSISSSNNFQQKGDLKILAILSGILNKPAVDFSFLLPDQSPIAGDYIALKKLEDFKKDKDEQLKQVASLLLLNAFIPVNSTKNVLTSNIPFNIAASTIGGVISGWLTGILNKELEKATNGKLSSVLDINSSIDLQNSAQLLQANIRTGFKYLLNNRSYLFFGGNLDYNNPYAIGNKSLITPEVTVEYLLTKDRRWKVVGFNKTSIVATDYTGLQRNKSGVKISYNKEFDKRIKSKKLINKITPKKIIQN